MYMYGAFEMVVCTANFKLGDDLHCKFLSKLRKTDFNKSKQDFQTAN